MLLRLIGSMLIYIQMWLMDHHVCLFQCLKRPAGAIALHSFSRCPERPLEEHGACCTEGWCLGVDGMEKPFGLIALPICTHKASQNVQLGRTRSGGFAETGS